MRLALAVVSAAWSILVRLPSAELALGLAVWGACITPEGTGVNLRWPRSPKAIRVLVAGAAAIAVALTVDRLYHFHRFGEWTSTYIGLFGRKWRQLHPGLPTGFPFQVPAKDGLLGFLLSPGKGVFFYDPLAAVGLVWLLRRSHTGRERVLRGLVLVAALDLVVLLAFYCRYYDWGGDDAWGPRFVTVPLQLCALCAVPLVRESWPRIDRRRAYIAGALAVGWQVISALFPPSLEVFQRPNPWERWTQFMRIENLFYVITGRTIDAPQEIRELYVILYRFPTPRGLAFLRPLLFGVAVGALVAACRWYLRWISQREWHAADGG